MAASEAALVQAVQDGDIDEVRTLIEKGVNINVFTSGKTPLSIAATQGNVSMLELLINSGQFTKLNKKQNHNPMNESGAKHKIRRKREKSSNNGYYVIIHDESDSKQHSPESESDVNKNTSLAVDDVTTPEGMDNLEWDMEVEGSEEENSQLSETEEIWSNQYRWYAKILANTYQIPQETNYICDVNLQDSVGRCAIHYAAEYGHINAVKLLLNAGCKADIGDIDSVAPLHLACSRGHTAVVQTLLDTGALVNIRTTDKLTPLHYAATRGYVDIVESLVRRGANIDALDSSERTPLKLAASRNLLDVVEVLIRYGARVNIEDVKGYTALCEAVWQKNVDMVRILLSAGAKLTPTSYLLHYAILHRQPQMVEVLVKAGAVINIRDDLGNTPLICAASSGQADIVKILLSHGAAVDFCGCGSWKTPLASALTVSEKPNPEVILALVEGGADLNKTSWGVTPLGAALINYKIEAALLLIGLGASVWRADPPDTMTFARNIGALTIVQAIVMCGYNLHAKCPDIKPLTSSSPALDLDSTEDWLTHYKYNPWRLTELCRVIVRKRAGRKVMTLYVKELGLPRSLEDFLLLKDIPIRMPEKLSSRPHAIRPFIDLDEE
ncbi:hypothetical protein O3M35_005745 [Rhynocoris fuscipes]|uniref:SOCS box domain-containing protein n=1 Tax=Rhynocoris fuscipes TaxID=488301 RepID=A0AAW1DLH0_9HEMI